MRWCWSFTHPDAPGALFELTEVLAPGRRRPITYHYQVRFCDRTHGGEGWLVRHDLHGHPPMRPVAEPHTHDHAWNSWQRSDRDRPLPFLRVLSLLLQEADARAGHCAEPPAPAEDCLSHQYDE